MKAVVLTGTAGKAAIVHDRAVPTLRPGYVLVDVKAVALNPTDVGHVDYLNNADSKDCLLGCDYAGVISATGTGYSKSWRVGDRICGFTIGGHIPHPEDGAFAEQILVKADVQMRVPDEMSFEDAATLGVGIFTCGQGLVAEMGLRRPRMAGRPENGSGGKDEMVLIYGGSTATGSLGVQFAALAGYRVITTCSPRHFVMVKSLGATEAYDYSDPASVDQINFYTNGELRYIWDTISTPATVAFCEKLLAKGGTYGSLLPGARIDREDVVNTISLAYSAIGEPMDKWGFKKDDTSEDFEFAKGWVEVVEALLTEKRLKPHPARTGNGLEGVMEGLHMLKEKKVSGEKLVYVL